MQEESRDEVASLAKKVDLLLRTMMQPSGKRYTYEVLQRKTGVKASTISRIRSGDNADPYFKTVIALSHAFGVRLSFFSTEMTVAEAETYLAEPQNTKFLDDLRLRQQSKENSVRHRQIDRIALRAARLDEEGLDAIADMLDYVLKQKGIAVEDEVVDAVK